MAVDVKAIKAWIEDEDGYSSNDGEDATNVGNYEHAPRSTFTTPAARSHSIPVLTPPA